ncbi:NAD-dependent epimerase/dehydratase family protein [Sphingomonas sp. 37zxx]|uniref:NAD-dependent epimerase/dehydratase family protein n=1 Tax=Sphingomonas sp. 37zxx TaxID=1550073 RepID=UPI00053BE15C|nr:NAD-dependent epimerase/dehydratase family protein [Sphingomonas sp. 37zxx]
MRVAITGAAGFVGRAVAARLATQHPEVALLLVDRAFDRAGVAPTLTGDLTDAGFLRAICDRSDVVIHLAALPGGAAEQDAAASRAINLDVPLALIDGMAGRRLVIAGSIAVFGHALAEPVDDMTPVRPASVYGTHKAMVELAFADAVRRAAVAGMVLRLPGIVARPAAGNGFGSAFLSDVFHAARQGRRYTLPAAADATSWLMSARTCAANLVAAALGPDSAQAAVTLPALRVRIGDLIAELARHGDVGGIDHAEDAATRRMFGSYPPLATPRADALGFAHDGTLAQLVETALADI